MFVIGIDCGTTSLKGIVMNKEGKIIDQESVEYSTSRPQIGYSEQDPNLWVSACDQVLESLFSRNSQLREACDGISFSGQMHSLVVLDESDNVIRPAILWNDVRTSVETKKINDEYGSLVQEVTLNRCVEGFTLPKILWLKNHEPETFDAIHKVLLPKDYIRFILTGNYNMDYSDAAGTLMLDVKKKEWSEELSHTFGYQIEWLPPLLESYELAGVLKSEYSKKYGLIKDVNVFAGGADNACAAFGSGIKKGIGMLSVGTSGVFLSEESKVANYKGKMHFFNSASGAYYSMGVTLSAGDSLKWARSIISPESSYVSLLKDINRVPCGSDGVMFTPYLNGERTPYFDSNIRGSFIGLDSTHTSNHMLRSVLEGITYSLKDSFELTKEIRGDDIKKIVSVGGGAKNPDWLQIQADILDKEIVTLEVEEGPALGAAMLASIGANWFDSIDSCIATCVSYKNNYLPNKKNVEIYKQYYEIYKRIYQSQKDICKDIINVRKEVSLY